MCCADAKQSDGPEGSATDALPLDFSHQCLLPPSNSFNPISRCEIDTHTVDWVEQIFVDTNHTNATSSTTPARVFEVMDLWEESEYLRGDPWCNCEDIASEDLAEWQTDFEGCRAKQVSTRAKPEKWYLPCDDCCDENADPTFVDTPRTTSFIGSSVLSSSSMDCNSLSSYPSNTCRSSLGYIQPFANGRSEGLIHVFANSLASTTEPNKCLAPRVWPQENAAHSPPAEALPQTDMHESLRPKLGDLTNRPGCLDDHQSRLATRQYMLNSCFTPVGDHFSIR